MGKKCAVLFSGGLDSSLSVCYMIEKGYDVDLLHYDQGALISHNLFEIRMAEIKRAYPKSDVSMHSINTSGLFRRLALVSIEQDILKHKHSLVCLGCKLAMHVRTIAYCKENNILVVADGSAARQKRYSEQRQVTIDYITALYKEYGIEYVNPIYELDDSEIKYGLFDRGMTIQALEDTCLFSHTFTNPTDVIVTNYLQDKDATCHMLIERSLSHEKNR